MNTVNFYQIIQLFDHTCSLRGSTGMLRSLWAEIACSNNQYANRTTSNMSKSIFQVKIRVQAPPQRGSAPAVGPGFDYIIPRGDLVCRHLTICGVLEYWSGGVMEETFFVGVHGSKVQEFKVIFSSPHCIWDAYLVPERKPRSSTVHRAY